MAQLPVADEILQETGDEIVHNYRLGGDNFNVHDNYWTEKPSITLSETESDIPTVIKEALKQFALPYPDIVLAFISGTKNFSTWKNEDHRAALQKGIVKILNACETWIIDSGIGYGLSSMIGHAVRDEQRYRKSRREYEVFAKGYLQNRRNQVILLGVTPTILLDNAKPNTNTTEFAVDPSHTHFLFLEGAAAGNGARQANVTVELVHQTVHHLREIPISPTTSVASKTQEKIAKHEQIPLIALLVQGDETSLDMVHTYLTRGVPVLVIRGTGFMADVLSYAYAEYKDKVKDYEMDETVCKTDISKRILRYFPQLEKDGKLMELCEKIIHCLVLARQSEKELICVVPASENLSDLDTVVLPAVFAARSKALNALPQQILCDFLLTMKLNRPNVAKSKVLNRDVDGVCLVNNDLFEKALLWNGHEAFVERFVEEDFVVHKFLNHSRLLRLFRMADNRDFFLGLLEDFFSSRTINLYDSFEESLVTIDLNMIIEELTGFPHFLSMHDLSSNYFGLYAENAFVAERKAMNALMVWAVLMNRVSLAQTLLKFCEDPIPVALFVSGLFQGLAKHSSDPALSAALEGHSRMFSMTAIDVLDMSYRESSARTFDLLNQKFVDFNGKTPIKMAYESENKFFLAHESCQIWLTRLWEGGITIVGQTDSLIPPEAKLILSALFLFPINTWIQFTGKDFLRQRRKSEMEAANDNPDGEGSSILLNTYPGRPATEHDPLDVSAATDNDKSPYTLKTLEELSMLENRLKSNKNTQTVKKLLKPTATLNTNRSASYSRNLGNNSLPFWRKVYYLWGAPRTKFWIFQVFYWIYLALFSIAVIQPTCHDTGLDIVIFFWTLFAVIEIALRTVYQVRNGFPVSIPRRALEIILITVLVLLSIILKINYTFVRPLYTRAFMATGLLYMYYRMVSVFFPMNPVLGPTLHRIKRMISVDFVAFVRLALPFIFANLFVLQSVMYPDLPLSVETWRQGFHRAFFTLFTAFIGEIEHSPRCEATRIYNTSDTCWTGDYADYTCPTLGVITYVLNIQYWIIMRLILMVLLSALFAATMIKVKEDAEYIFKYQRYKTVLDFASRSALPPPLSVLGYCFDWIVACCVRTKRIDRTQQKNLTHPRSIKIINKRADVVRSSESYSYWMGLTKEYYRRKRVDEERRRNLINHEMSSTTDSDHMTFDLLV